MSGVHAVVLAAGKGLRFGGGKLLASWRGGVLLDGALAAALAAPVRSVVVVTGADAQAVAAAARASAGDRIIVVHAPDHAEGMAASLRAGIAALPADATGALVFLGDMPLVPHAVLAPLVQALEGGAVAATPQFQGRRGHPAALSAALFPQVAALKGDEGARRILDLSGEALVLVESVDGGVLFDVDTPADIEGL